MSEVVESSAQEVRLGDEKEEEKLKAQQTEQQDWLKFTSVFENANDCMFVLDMSGRILDVNKKAVDIFGRTKEELYGKHFSRVNAVSLKDVPRLVSGLAEVFAGKKFSLMLNVRSKMGREIALDCSGSLMKVGDKPSVLVIARDISERQRMEEALKESEERHRSLVELAPDGILISDLKGKVTSVNEAFLRITGFSREEIVGKHFTKLPTIREIDMPSYVKLFFSYLRGKKVGPVEFTYRRKDGTLAWGDAHPAVLKEKGKVTGFQVVLRDITERKKAAEALRKSEERYRELTESISDVFFAMNENLRYTYWNKASEKLTGVSAKDAIGKSLTEVFPDVRGTRVERFYLETLRTQQPGIFVNEYPMGGKDFVFEINAYPTKDGLSVFVKDITESMRAEEALRKNENKYKTLLENLPQKIFLKDRNSVYVSCNENYARDLKINPNQITGKTDYDFYPKELAEKYRADDKRIMESRKTEDIEEEYIQDGQKAFVHTVKTPVKDENGNVVGILGIFRDITDRKRMEDELKRYSEHLEALVEERTRKLKEAQGQLLKAERLAAIGELATMVGHDLRNPLQSIENAAFYLNNELTNLSASVPLSQKTTEMLQVINDSINYADKIIRDLQDFSATKPPKLDNTDINAIVKETLSQVQVPKNVELSTELDYLPEMMADKDQITRVFLNLTTNAIQAMENGGTLIISTKKTNGFIEISFKDTGVGISKENIEKIFVPFYTTKSKGMGMGLPICKKFVEGHGGRIEVESQVGKGTTFSVRLPILKDNGGEKT